ncbi:homoserine O-acetyltransferase [Candidatus Sumerlaeota bacterium]|nr:homoserine O-acetyltransferase [Candidatus Sumerlaeota bacterium]
MIETQLQYIEISTEKNPFRFADGKTLHPVTLAYETYGRLNKQKDNAILLFHALSGSAHAAGINNVGPGNAYWTEECHTGWWNDYLGPGRGIDSDKYFVICINWVGGCYGSTGPSSINPATGKPHGGAFPFMTMQDIVSSQVKVLDLLGIRKLLAVVGSSLGGLCVMDFATRFPERTSLVIPIATGVRSTVLTKAMNFEQICAIQEDSNFRSGDYYDHSPPNAGLTLARMISHKTFVSLPLMESRARKEIVHENHRANEYRIQHQVESYLLHQGRKFVKRFDANSYLRIAAAWSAFDLPKQQGKSLERILSRCRDQVWLLFSIMSDVCFYPEEQLEIANALKANGIDYQHIRVDSKKGHDSFLIEPDLYSPYISFKIDSIYNSLRAKGSAEQYDI